MVEKQKHSIPEHLVKDRYWGPIIFLFQKNPKLKQYFSTKYFDLQERVVKVDSLKRAARPWSPSERFMLNLALHLYNERHKLNLSDMDHIDYENKEMAFTAMMMRFN